MKKTASLTEKELDVLVRQDNPAALNEMGCRASVHNEPAEARKYFTFASVLGCRDAHIHLARIYEEERRFDDARDLYALAYTKGDDSALPKYARTLMFSDAKLGLDILKYNAIDGHIGCIEELKTICTENGDEKELSFWSNWLERIKKEAAADERMISAASKAQKPKKKRTVNNE